MDREPLTVSVLLTIPITHLIVFIQNASSMQNWPEQLLMPTKKIPAFGQK